MNSQPICPFCGHEEDGYLSTDGGYAICHNCGELYKIEVGFRWHEDKKDYDVIYSTSRVGSATLWEDEEDSG